MHVNRYDFAEPYLDLAIKLFVSIVGVVKTTDSIDGAAAVPGSVPNAASVPEAGANGGDLIVLMRSILCILKQNNLINARVCVSAIEN